MAQALPDVVSVILIDGDVQETWPDPGVVGFRRSGSAGELTVNFTLTGTAARAVDYSVAAGDSITLPDGEREVWLSFNGLPDALKEPAEKIIVTLATGAGYTLPTLAAQKSVTLVVSDATAKPCAKEACRFLTQAAFGPDADASTDADILPQNVASVMSLGFDKWIDDQAKRPLGLHQPYLDYLIRAKVKVYSQHKVQSWWRRVMGVSSLYPGAPAQSADPLRQRLAFALSEIFVISDHLEALGNEPVGMLNYYDVLVRGAFGNFRDLLFKVATHPCMGEYLSHLKNAKADPDAGTFPDENFAREIMQLFTIGLWELDEYGERKLAANGEAIPTYDNATITNMARAFTGFSFSGPKANDFWYPPSNYKLPMKMWDEFHDMAPKTLLKGVVLPARTASTPDKGTAGMLDVNAAIDCLFNHPNTGPFICKQLIQRFVTSNPSKEYVKRVADKFANNGSNVRGDMKAVIKAILLDTEARSPAMLASATFGKMKEPYLRTVNFARAFNARSTSGSYRMEYLRDVHFQEPLSAVSVFNFFKPGYSPAGPLSDAGLVAPEFQILNTISAVALPNYYSQVFSQGFNRYGDSNSAYIVRPQLANELKLYGDVPALMRRLDLVLTGGTLPPEQHQIIREAVEAIPVGSYNWKNERIQLAVYLIVTSPEAAILR